MLKLVEHVMQVVERRVASLVIEMVYIGNIHFGVIQGCSITDTIFARENLKKLYFAFIHLEQARSHVRNNGTLSEEFG